MTVRTEIIGIRLSLIVAGAVLAGFLLGVLFSDLSAGREVTQQRSELRARTVLLLKAFEEIAGADSVAGFSNGVIETSRSVESLSQFSFPRIQPLRDEVVERLFATTSSFLEAATCWAEYEHPGRPGQDVDAAGSSFSKPPAERPIDDKRRELEQRIAGATRGSDFGLRIAERRATLATEREKAGVGDSSLADASAIAEWQRIAEVRLAAAECVQKQRAEGLNKLTEIHGLLETRF